MLLLCKGLAYTAALGAFRGGPTFPAMFLGAAGGIALSHLPGLTLVPAVAMGLGAMTAAMLRLPMTAVLLTTLFLGTDGFPVIPLTIVAVVVAHVAGVWLAPRQAEATGEPDTQAEGPSAGAAAARRAGGRTGQPGRHGRVRHQRRSRTTSHARPVAPQSKLCTVDSV